MKAKKVLSEVGTWWVWAEYIPKEAKLSKSEKDSYWYLVSSWGSEEGAEAACEYYRSFP